MSDLKQPGQRAYETWMRSVYKERRVDPSWPEVDKEERAGWAAVEQACAVPAEPEQTGKAQGWIPVEERLPPKGEFVLAYAPARGVDLAHLENGSHGESVWFWSFQGYGILSEVTHWQPLPAPPTKDPTNG